MGSDMSRPKNKCKNNYTNTYNDKRCKTRPYSKSMVFRDIDFELPPNIVFHERGSSPMQLRSNRKSIENGYIERSPRPVRSLNESPVNISLSNNSTPRMPRNQVYYADISNEKSSNKLDRYKSNQRYISRREDERYLDKREPIQYTLPKNYQPSVYENFDSRKHDLDISPPDRIYEVRKEKVILKSDRSVSPIPTRIRSKSSERILDCPKTVRYEDEYYNKSSNDDSELHKQKLQSRQNYFINGNNSQVIMKDTERYRENVYIDNKRSHHRHNSRDNYDNRNSIETKSTSAVVNVVNNSSEIVYVPMVKEEFIKRESQKSNNAAQSKKTNTITLSSLSSSSPTSSSSSITDNNNSSNNINKNNIKQEILKVQRNPNKIIITELLPSATVEIDASVSSKIISPSNGAISKSNVNGQQIYQHEDDILTQAKQFQQTSISTFQPIKSQSKNSASSKSLNILDNNNPKEISSTHYIILPDPKIDTKIIDGILKNNKDILHYE